MDKKKIYELLSDIVGEEYVKIDEPMSKHTTFKIGGAADVFVTPQTIEHIQDIIEVCKKEHVDFYIIGKGSNLLVSDKGYRGVIICIYNTLDNVKIVDNNENTRVYAGAGVMLSKLAHDIADHSLEGFEFAAGIPGTLGGAVTMNAGAYGGEINDCIVAATVIDKEGNVFRIEKANLELGYRHSIIMKEDYIVVEAEFEFCKGDKSAIEDKIKDLNKRRREKQPLEYPSAGSTFKRPEGYFAGKLIMDSGLSGYSVGDACVSEKHCGFVINKGQASAYDVKELMTRVDNTVFDKYGVHLEPEVRLLGEF